MSARQRLPRLGSRLVYALVQDGSASSGSSCASVLERSVAAQASRVYHALAPHVRGAAPSALQQATAEPRRPVTAPLVAQQQLRGFADLPAHSELAMPSLSPTMSQGNIVAWRKKEGDAIQPGDVLCEVETDKATIEWEAQEEGFLAKILLPTGAKDIPVGTPVALVVEDEGDLAAFKDYTPSSEGGAKEAAPAAPSTPKAEEPKKDEAAKPAASGGGGGSFPPHNVLSMPALSPTMSEGNIIAWRKKEGDEVAAGDVFAEVETDKATIEWESQEDGFIAKILVPEGSNGIAIGAPVLVLVDDKDAVAQFSSFTAEDANPGGAPKKPAAAEEKPAEKQPAAPAAPAAAAPKPGAAPKAATAAAPAGGRIVASPYAKKLAAEAGVSLEGLAGSGPGGRIVAEDVQRLISSGGGKPAAGEAAAAAPAPKAAAGGATAPAGEYTDYYTDIPTTQIKRVTAKRLLESKQQIPHYYLTSSIRIDALSKLRAQLNETLAASDGGKLSLNDFIIKASALALRKVPACNSSWHGDFVRQYNVVDCSVAVQTPIGLMVPVVRDADTKGLAQIAAEVKQLAAKAKDGKLQPDEFTGGTFTVSNLGMYGVTQFAAIVNPPQACILAVGGAEKRVVSGPSGFEEGTFMQVTLSCDHRVVDGAVGAQWVQAFKSYLENPASMLL